MAVRNWWIDADIDGRQTDLSGGPRSKDGGFELRIYQREDGEIKSAGHLKGRVDSYGNLILEGSINGTEVELVTKR